MAKQQEKIKEFRQLAPGQLKERLREKNERLCDLGFDLAAGRVKNVREIRAVKKDIARISTLLSVKKQ